jgi:T5orf172 domain
MRVHQKWGFGMAPVKPGTQERRTAAAGTVLGLLESAGCPDLWVADEISEIKGVFTRCFKQDQWDWFTVWTQLGRPGRKNCLSVSETLGRLRQVIIQREADRIPVLCEQLRQAGAIVMLHKFLDTRPRECSGDDGIGYIYIMSTRSDPNMLKIGYTERTVEERVKEINRATGIFEPYGVRAVWTVLRAPQAEKAVHDALTEYRVRPDREFFELKYATACKIVEDIVHSSRREL